MPMGQCPTSKLPLAHKLPNMLLNVPLSLVGSGPSGTGDATQLPELGPAGIYSTAKDSQKHCLFLQ